MDAGNLRPMKKNEAKKVLVGNIVPFYGIRGKHYDVGARYYEDLISGREYEIKKKYIPKGDRNNIYFVVDDNNGKQKHIHRRFFGVRR